MRGSLTTLSGTSAGQNARRLWRSDASFFSFSIISLFIAALIGTSSARGVPLLEKDRHKSGLTSESSAPRPRHVDDSATSEETVGESRESTARRPAWAKGRDMFVDATEEDLRQIYENSPEDDPDDRAARTLYNVMGVEMYGPKGSFVIEDAHYFLNHVWSPTREAVVEPFLQFLQFLVLSPFIARRPADLRAGYQPNPDDPVGPEIRDDENEDDDENASPERDRNESPQDGGAPVGGLGRRRRLSTTQIFQLGSRVVVVALGWLAERSLPEEDRGTFAAHNIQPGALSGNRIVLSWIDSLYPIVERLLP